MLKNLKKNTKPFNFLLKSVNCTHSVVFRALYGLIFVMTNVTNILPELIMLLHVLMVYRYLV